MEEQLYCVILLGVEYKITASSRSKAITQAIRKWREENPDSSIPLGVLRSLASAKLPSVKITKEDIERLFNAERTSSPTP